MSRLGNGKNIARSTDINFDASVGDYPFLTKGEYRKKLIPVGSFEPNELGLGIYRRAVRGGALVR